MEADLYDLGEANFPLFEERLKFLENPGDKVLDFAGRVDKADGVIIVCPEYNGGYPAAFKNAFDLLYTEWKHKPVGIASISGGAFGGAQVTVQLQSVVTKVGMVPISAVFPVPKVSEAFDENGTAINDRMEGRAEKFLDNLAMYVQNMSGS